MVMPRAVKLSLLQQSQASVPLSFIIWHTSEEEIEVIFVVKVVICKKIFSPNLEEKVDCAHRRVLRVGGDGSGDLGDDGENLMIMMMAMIVMMMVMMTMVTMMVTMVITSAQVAAAARELEVELARLSTCHVRLERC